MAIYVARTSTDMTCKALDDTRLWIARSGLKNGRTLTETAHRLGMCSNCLDLALWRAAGRS